MRYFEAARKTVVDLGHRHKHHPPKDDQNERYVEIRQLCLALSTSLAYLTPPSREQSLAFTKIEEAQFWANSAISRNE